MENKTWPIYVPFISGTIAIFLFFILLGSGTIILQLLSILPLLFATQALKYLAQRLIFFSTWKLLAGTMIIGLLGYSVFEDVLSELLSALHTTVFFACVITSCFHWYYRSKFL